MKFVRNILFYLTILLLIIHTSSAEFQGRDAWSYAGNSTPIPESALWIQATAAQKSAISYNDPNRWETKLPTNHDQLD